MHFKLVVWSSKYVLVSSCDFVWLEAVVVYVDGLVMWETGCFVAGHGEAQLCLATYLIGA